MNKNLPIENLINNIDIVLPSSKHLPKYINNDTIIKKIKYLRIKFKQLIKKSSKLSKNDFKLIIDQYSNEFPINKFVSWMLNWYVYLIYISILISSKSISLSISPIVSIRGRDLLIRTEAMYPSIKPPSSPPNHSILIHENFNDVVLVKGKDISRHRVSSEISEIKEDDGDNNKMIESNEIDNNDKDYRRYRINSLLNDSDIETVDNKIRKLNNSLSSSLSNILCIDNAAYIENKRIDNVTYINNNSIASNIIQEVHSSGTYRMVSNDFNKCKKNNINIEEMKFNDKYEDKEYNYVTNINDDIELINSNNESNCENSCINIIKKRKQTDNTCTENIDYNITNKKQNQNSIITNNNEKKGFISQLFDYISFENENENDYFL
jgi:hypothetical protein